MKALIEKERKKSCAIAFVIDKLTASRKLRYGVYFVGFLFLFLD